MEKVFSYVDHLGNVEYFKNVERTVRHRDNGPAIVKADGSKQFYIDGAWVTEEWYTKIYPDWKQIVNNSSQSNFEI